MGKLIYLYLASLDGYVEDEDGNFDWAAPDEEVHSFVNDLTRPVRTYLYGRRMYETMAAWETMDSLPEQEPVILDFARIWQAADKVVYSTTLDNVSTARTRLERTFERDEQLLRPFQRFACAVEFDPAVAHRGLDAELLLQGVEIARIVIEQLLRDSRVFEMKRFRGHD